MSDSKDNKVLKKSKAEPAYRKTEVLAAAHVFGVTVDVMAGALRRVDKEHLTRTEIEKAIQNFKGKQV
ncbi:MAG: oligoribonuclease [Paenibacillus macerans]|uniref:oligoribonuclease n=1 Tax=Paenibacillus macerans TaxID=44252 RepID=UPI001F0F047D|nr:oligoribonuclease [Paenibacillus macerans]MDU5945460.1 oligoribonuclease [Paenibacillus macerans]MDU7473623.1 oligoribonuclease [Paenibacillus macerans]MEC0139207.1 oligoribonuclease [Paenibacillus macerans]UMV47288.1 oligoribonuclease [Paenibacillus macerans]